ncbi:ligase-associated DNA damage response DEXH box helicase [Rhizobacter sp. AJA081-3]|uniref:ligase-associated DNA damage response DEXH box helicase n=1 Tax=Rhizobacter sp. AJA081-3 TaxID=2753607 RepID=UPI001ADF7B05|nr:ligase-associated DNA damage response DEXH box helicase [Rhizobacter sp. AJA081-3]QTN23980.1 ligase-associated DNA damage response DEXH box helicase [Rhizobacter sp. AJA081-3]
MREPPPPAPDDEPARRWFASRGWQPFDFQREVWAAMVAGRSGLLHATTGSGKTYAVALGALQRGLALAQPARGAPPLQVLWLTPMRALAADTTRALTMPLADLAPEWTLGQRSGDTPAAERARQDKRFPTVLVTTPESLSLMLTRENAAQDLGAVHTVVVDEWHELMGNKRGVQVQLAIARLARWNPDLVVWGLSATLGNLDEAMRVLVGAREATLVQGRIDKTLVIDTLLPANPGRFSWGGHLGAQMQLPVVAEIERSSTTLVFTNTRSQAEIWYQLLIQERPEWAGLVALHHGSLDKEVREWVELGLKEGRLKAVVATSSLDLGVDFLPVERVLQIGSPKGIARLLQRAGRSGHAPGRPSRVTIVPTNTLELVEAAAARRAAKAGRIEQRASPDKPLDVLVQHLVTVALGGGFEPESLYAEVRGAHAFRELTRAEFQWALDFVEKGGASLAVYPEYHRVALVDGLYRVPDRGIAKRHRLQVGTIVGDASMQVKYLSGGKIGTIEESFIARLRPGDCFVFAGRVLEFIRTQDMAAYVKKATKSRGIVPSWAGGRMPLSTELADAVVELLAEAAQGDWVRDADEPEMQAAAPMLATQMKLSRLPTPRTLLIERYRSREGEHLYLYPFAGRNVHLGLASLLAWRLAKHAPNTFSMSVNDHGFELLSAEPVDVASLLDQQVFSAEHLLEDVLASLNSGELAQRRFREIARVSGLIFTGYPGAAKSTRQLQASSGLFYEVFRKYDAGNLLLTQAQAEVLSQELDILRLAATLKRLSARRIEFVELKAPSPFSLPLMVERFREKLSNEKLADRLERIVRDAERMADR